MADSNDQRCSGISGRGAFVIGLALGAGVLFLYASYMRRDLQDQIDKLRDNLDEKVKEAIRANADEWDIRDLKKMFNAKDVRDLKQKLEELKKKAGS